MQAIRRKVDVAQLTNGNWQVEWAKWNAAMQRIVYSRQRRTASDEAYFRHTVSPVSNTSNNMMS